MMNPHEESKNPQFSRRDILKIAVPAMITAASDVSAQDYDWLNPPKREGKPVTILGTNPAIMHFRGRCLECGFCRDGCPTTKKTAESKLKFSEEPCIHCGQCIYLCPNGVLTERFHFPLLYSQMKQNETAAKKKVFVALLAPAVRVTLGEMFRQEPGTDMEGQIVAGLRKIGFDYVFDVTFGADLTVMEETAEFLARDASQEKSGEAKLPFFTSCCPAWVKYAEYFYPELLPAISTCKSPILMQAAVVKSWFAKEKNIAPEDIVVTAVTPCTAKKYEILRGEAKLRDVDFALTAREIGWWMTELGVRLPELDAGEYDAMMPHGSGSGVLFGGTGGVAEAALATLHFRLTGENPPERFVRTSFAKSVPGMRILEADIAGRTFRAGVIHQTLLAERFLQERQKSPENADFRLDFVEVMACPGGCIGGGGLPIHALGLGVPPALAAQRLAGLRKKGAADAVRYSHENPEVKKLYADFLGEPGKELLHTTYMSRQE